MIQQKKHSKEEYEQINKDFPSMLQYYYDNGRPEDYLTNVIWPIVFECCLNCCIQKYRNLKGKARFDVDKYEDWAIEAAMILITRIKNEKKYPKGYVIQKLPTTCYFALLVVSAKYKKLEEQEAREYEYIEAVSERYRSNAEEEIQSYEYE